MRVVCRRAHGELSPAHQGHQSHHGHHGPLHQVHSLPLRRLGSGLGCMAGSGSADSDYPEDLDSTAGTLALTPRGSRYGRIAGGLKLAQTQAMAVAGFLPDHTTSPSASPPDSSGHVVATETDPLEAGGAGGGDTRPSSPRLRLSPDGSPPVASPPPGYPAGAAPSGSPEGSGGASGPSAGSSPLPPRAWRHRHLRRSIPLVARGDTRSASSAPELLATPLTHRASFHGRGVL